jgi:hypothetical protein
LLIWVNGHLAPKTKTIAPPFAMKPLLFLLFAAGVAGCASSNAPPSVAVDPPANAGRGPNWEEIDKTVQRVRAREEDKPRLVETSRTTDTGFRTMTDDEYTTQLEKAREEVRKASPKMAAKDVEAEATKRADAAKRSYERSVSTRASSTYEVKK